MARRTILIEGASSILRARYPHETTWTGIPGGPPPDPDPDPDPPPDPGGGEDDSDDPLPPDESVDLGTEAGVNVGPLTAMRLVPTGPTSADLRFISAVAGTMRCGTTWWPNAIGKSQIMAEEKANYPMPKDHVPRNADFYKSACNLRVDAPVVIGENSIELSNDTTLSRVNGVEEGMRIGAHFFIELAGGGEVGPYHSNVVYLHGKRIRTDFGSGTLDITDHEDGSHEITVTDGPFAGTYEIGLPVTAAVKLHDPVLTGTGSVGQTLTVTPMPVVWPGRGLVTRADTLVQSRRPRSAFRWHRNGTFVVQTDDPWRVCVSGDIGTTITVEERQTQHDVTVTATTNGIAVS